MDSESSLKQYVGALIVILLSCGHMNGAVTLSPSGIAPVCSGDQLELTCTLTDPGSRVLEWSFTPTTSSLSFPARAIEATGQGNQTTQFMINSTWFTTSRTSADGQLPFVSSLLINPVTIGLNGTVVGCTDTIATMETASAILSVMNRLQDDPEINKTEQFGNDEVTVTLEWTQENSYNFSITPYLPIIFSGEKNIELKVSYKTAYNVSVLTTLLNPCGQNVAFFELYYSKCADPMSLVDSSIIILGYNSPAMEGSDVTFSCPSGMRLSGTNTSTCMVNGEWEPDPQGINCDTGFMTVGSPGFPIVGVIVGSVFGVLLVLIIMATTIVTFLLKGGTRGLIDFCNRKPELEFECVDAVAAELPQTHDDNNHFKVATGTLMYADIGQTLNHQRPSIPVLDDTPIEYAKINHSSHTSKHSVPRTSVPAKLNEKRNDDDGSLSVDLDNLLIQLRAQVTPKWYQFGMAAGIEREVLDKFAKQCSPEDCIVEMLDCWLRCGAKPSWKDVANILKTINLTQLALDIEGVYATGKLPVKVDMDWRPQVQDTCVSGIETPPPIPPKIMETSLSNNMLLPAGLVEPELNSRAPILPPKPFKIDVPPRPPK